MKTMAVVIIILSFFLLACSMTCCQEMGGSSSSGIEEREAYGVGIRQEPIAKSTVAPVEQAPQNTSNLSVSTDAAKTDMVSEESTTQSTATSVDMDVSVREVGKSHRSKSHSSESSSDTAASQSSADDSTAKTDENEVVTPKNNRPDKISIMEGTTSVDKPKDKKTKSTAVTVLGMIGKLAIVCILAYLALLMVKTVYNKQESKPHTSREVKLVDTIRLTPSSTVHVLNVHGKKLLIGCSANQVNLIQELEPDQVTEVPAETSKRFAEYMQQYSAGSKTDNPTQRIAGLLRDCSTYLRKRYPSTVPAGRGGESNES